MTTIYFDTETFPVRDGLKAPRLVVMSYCIDDGPPRLASPRDAVDLWVSWLALPDAIVVGHNVSFDMAVMIRAAGDHGRGVDLAMRLVFRAYQAKRILDTMYMAKLNDLAWTGHFPRGAYNLGALASRYLGVDRSAEKSDPAAWRTRYNELADVPLDQWPDKARTYALDDATDTRGVFQAICQEYGTRQRTVPQPPPGSHTRAYSAWALHLASVWGIRVSPRIEDIGAAQEATIADLRGQLIRSWIMRPNGKWDNKAIAAEVQAACGVLGVAVPTTDKGATKRDKATLQDLVTASPILRTKLEYDAAEVSLTRFVNKLRPGQARAICPSYDALKETGRTSSFGAYPIQQTPRKGGVRECIVPRTGWVYAIVDYDSAELRAWAQVCLDLLGHSTLAKRYQADPHFDPHTYFAALLLGTTYEDALHRKAEGDPAVKEGRQFGKIANFGYPGGMGAYTLVEYARGYGLEITPDFATELKSTWMQAWPEAQSYLRYIGDEIGLRDSCTITQLRSNRVRAHCSYCQACNTLFQGLVADGALDAMREVQRECWAVPSSPLYGCRPVAFVHDEIVMEIPPHVPRTPAAQRLAKVMRDRLQAWLPDVPVSCEPALSEVWSKDAESRLDLVTRELTVWTV